MFFAPYCPQHKTRVLVAYSSIDELRRVPEGWDLHFTCSCGFSGWSTDEVEGRLAS